VRRQEVQERLGRLELPFNAYGVDPYGVSRWHLGVVFEAMAFFYRNYFRVKCHGIEHVPARGRAMLVGNHSGGVAVDGAMVVASCFLEANPPRLAQAMAEKFIALTAGIPAGELVILASQQQSSAGRRVIAGELRELVVEVLKAEVDAKSRGVFQKELAKERRFCRNDSGTN